MLEEEGGGGERRKGLGTLECTPVVQISDEAMSEVKV